MLYKDLEMYFSDKTYEEFIKESLSHIKNLDKQPTLDNCLFFVAEKFRTNKELEFYITQLSHIDSSK